MPYGVITPVDTSGRLADRAPLKALGWPAGRPIDISCDGSSVTVTECRDGRWKITQQGHLLLPASLRRSYGIAAGDRVLALAHPDRASLLVYTMRALDLMVALYESDQKAR